MNVLISDNWQDYELIDTGDGKRLERFDEYVLIRPDPQIIWKPSLPASEWKKADAIFERTSSEKGLWKRAKQMPDNWQISYNDLKFLIKLSPFKHTGVFPEQAVHWEWMNLLIVNLQSLIGKQENNSRSTINDTQILNLFGYTGAASLVAAKAGAKVTHVDASYPTIGWAKENLELNLRKEDESASVNSDAFFARSRLQNKPIRWILDDCLKFCQREVKRGVKYDGIIMDPPVYGHGPKGEVWDFNKSFPKLMEACSQLLTPNPIFFIVNAYAVSTSSITLENVLKDYLKDLGGNFESGELALQDKSGKLLSTGIYARWSSR